MKIYDQHLHTFLSSDSNEKFKNYLEIAQNMQLSHFVTTEHLDLSCMMLGRDDIPDLEKQERLKHTLQEKYDIKILKGIELGYKFSRIQDIKQIVNERNFDVIIMSVHENEETDCAMPAFLENRTSDEAYSAYLDIYIDMLKNCDCFDIVGHIDFLLRYIGKVTIENHKDKLEYLFKLVIEKEKSLEFNTRFLYRHNDSFYLRYIFTLYYKNGGRKVALGSDAHTTNDFMGDFDRAIGILKEIGFSSVVTYQNRKESFIEI